MDRRDQEALSGLTDGVAHLLAFDFAKPTGTQLFVRPTRPDATWCELHEASFPDSFFGTSFFSFPSAYGITG